MASLQLPAAIVNSSSTNNNRRRSAVSAESVQHDKKENIKVYAKSTAVNDMLLRRLQTVGLFSHLDKEQLQDVADAMFEKSGEKGFVIIHEGDEGDNFYILEEGAVEFSKRGRGVVGQGGPGTSFGELALMYHCPRAATVTLTAKSKLWGLERELFQRIVVYTMNKQREKYFNFLQNVPILTSLTKAEKYRVADALRPVTFTPGEFIIRQGEAGTAFFIVEAGECSVWKDEMGPGVELKRVVAGDYFGEIALLTNKPRAANVTVLSASVKTLRLDCAAFSRLLGPCEELLRHNIRFYKKIYETFVNEVSLFASLTQTEKEKVAASLFPKTFKSGECIIMQGDPGSEFFVVEDGTAAAVFEDSKVQVKTYQKGDYFGELALLNNAPRKASVYATSDITCLVLDSKSFTNLLGPLEDILKRNMQHYRTYESIGAAGGGGMPSFTNLRGMADRSMSSSSSSSTGSSNSNSSINSPDAASTGLPTNKNAKKSSETKSMIQRALAANLLTRTLKPSEIDALASCAYPMKVAANTTVIRQGDNADNIYVIEDGEVSVTIDGTVAVAVLGPRDVFGEYAVMFGCPRTATVKSVDPATLWVLPSEAFKAIVKNASAAQAESKVVAYEDVLLNVPVFQHLTVYEKALVAESMVLKTFHDGELIITQQDKAENSMLHIVVDGSCVVFKTPAAGEDPVELKWLEEGDYCGQLSLLGRANTPMKANVISYGTSSTISINRDTLLRLMNASGSSVQEILRGRGKDQLYVIEALLEDVDLLVALTKIERRKLANTLRVMQVKSGVVVYRAGEDAVDLFIVMDGELVMMTDGNNGSKKLRPGDLFGEEALLGGGGGGGGGGGDYKRTSTVAVAVDGGSAVLLTTDRRSFEALLGSCELIAKRNRK